MDIYPQLPQPSLFQLLLVLFQVRLIYQYELNWHDSSFRDESQMRNHMMTQRLLFFVWWISDDESHNDLAFS